MPFLDYEGKLAFTAGWFTDPTRPVQTRIVRISKARAADWSLLLDDSEISRIDWSGNAGLVHLLNHRPVRLDTSDWETIIEEEPIKKPRRGKRQGQRYDWEWRWGEWARKWI